MIRIVLFSLVVLGRSFPLLEAFSVSNPERTPRALNSQSNDEDHGSDSHRRQLFSSTAGWGALLLQQPAHASNAKSRTAGYAVQKSDEEWSAQLSEMQYYVLRRGGTESPNSSILEGEDRPGTFVCAGCGTELFASTEKFHSGTGWPSFARALPGVEVDAVNPITANLVGAELRCGTCGGHLGDVFNDGFLFVGTPAFVSGKRYCIDGAALIFRPSQGGEAEVRGDTMKPQTLPSWFDPPQIKAQ
jgi:peptide-methionine (R)-S-oxide reductase